MAGVNTIVMFAPMLLMDGENGAATEFLVATTGFRRTKGEVRKLFGPAYPWKDARRDGWRIRPVLVEIGDNSEGLSA